jgi:hypothetical protein
MIEITNLSSFQGATPPDKNGVAYAIVGNEKLIIEECKTFGDGNIVGVVSNDIEPWLLEEKDGIIRQGTKVKFKAFQVSQASEDVKKMKTSERMRYEVKKSLNRELLGAITDVETCSWCSVEDGKQSPIKITKINYENFGGDWKGVCIKCGKEYTGGFALDPEDLL